MELEYQTTAYLRFITKKQNRQIIVININSKLLRIYTNIYNHIQHCMH